MVITENSTDILSKTFQKNYLKVE